MENIKTDLKYKPRSGLDIQNSWSRREMHIKYQSELLTVRDKLGDMDVDGAKC